MLIGTNDGIVTLEEKNGAWEIVRHDLKGIRVEGICADNPPGNVCVYGLSVIAATEQGIFETSALPEAWEWSKTLPDVDTRCLTVTLDGTVFVGADNAVLYRRRAAEELFSEVESLRDLPTYATWTFPVSPHMPNIRALAASPTAPGRVYVGVEVGGIMLTEDDGETWQEARESIHPDVHGLAVAPDDGDHVFAVTGVGFYRSQDVAVPMRGTRDDVRRRDRERPRRAAAALRRGHARPATQLEDTPRGRRGEGVPQRRRRLPVASTDGRRPR